MRYNGSMSETNTTLEDVLDQMAEMSPEDAEDYLITMERLRRFDTTRRGLTLDQVRDWMKARKIDPEAPCPSPARID